MGSVTVETNASGTAIARYTYDPFGATRVTGGAAIAAANPYRYGGAYGAYTDNSTGLIKMGARYYNAAQGRFTQPDPSGQEANAYLYAGSDPINNMDPSGLFEWSTASVLKGVGVGLAIGAVFFSGGTALALAGIGAAADAWGGYLAGDSATDIAVGVGADLLAGGVGLAAEAVGVSGVARYAVNGSYAGIAAGYGVNSLLG